MDTSINSINAHVYIEVLLYAEAMYLELNLERERSERLRELDTPTPTHQEIESPPPNSEEQSKKIPELHLGTTPPGRRALRDDPT